MILGKQSPLRLSRIAVTERSLRGVHGRTKGCQEQLIREMLIEALERRFGTVDAVPKEMHLELLSDNGGA